MKLQSIAKEAEACRAAWAAKPRARYGVHIHHETPVEKLTEPIENRIAYILREKPEKEQALRLRLMRPITAEQYAEYDRVVAPARAEYDRVTVAAGAEYNRMTAAAWAEYDRVTVAALAEYNRVEAAAWAECEPVCAPARAEYERATAPAHLPLCVPDCPFDGQSIFAKEKQ